MENSYFFPQASHNLYMLSYMKVLNLILPFTAFRQHFLAIVMSSLYELLWWSWLDGGTRSWGSWCHRMSELNPIRNLTLKARLHDATKTCDVRQNRTMYVIRAYCDMRLSQESWMISTFLRQHATVAQISPFTQRDSVACRISFVASCKRTLNRLN